MIGRPAARITDMTIHLLPGGLTPGAPSANVMIGGLMAWKGAPGGAGATLKDDKDASDARIRKGVAACTLAGNTPTAKAALEALKIKEQAEMTKKIMDAAASGASVHACISIAPIPVGVPHGPGLVINGSPTVLINGLPACRIGDEILEAFGPKNFILLGQFNVLIGNGPTPSLAQMLANAIARLKNMAKAAMKLAQMLDDLFSMEPSKVIARLQRTVSGIEKLADRIGNLLGVDGVGAKVSKIVEAIRDDVNAVVDGAVEAASEAARGPVNRATAIASEIAEGVGKAARTFRDGIEDAAQKELDDLRKTEQGARKMYDRGSKTIDRLADEDGPVGMLGRELQERRDYVEREKRGAENIARKGAEIAGEGADKVRETKQDVREAKQKAREAAESTAREAARKIGDLAQGFADGLGATPEAPHDHDHPDHAH